MLLKRTNIHEKLLREQLHNTNAGDSKVINWVNQFLNKTPSSNARILDQLKQNSSEQLPNVLDFDKLEVVI